MIPESELKPIVDAADDAFPEGIALSRTPDLSAMMSASIDVAKTERLIELIDAALARHPRDTDLLMAKASALCRMIQMKSGEDVIDQVLAIDPGHVDAKRRKDVWEKWPLLFEYPLWNERSTSPQVLYTSELGGVGPTETKMLLARTGLRIEPVAVQCTDGLIFNRGIRADMRGMVQVKVVETPYGPIAPWYVLLEDDPSNAFVREAFLTASGGTLSALSGTSLLERLVESGGCHLVFTAGSKVLYNRRVELLPEQREAVRKALPALLRDPAPMDQNQIRRAAKWYADNSDFSEIRFPGAAPNPGKPELTHQLVPPEPEVVSPPPPTWPCGHPKDRGTSTCWTCASQRGLEQREKERRTAPVGCIAAILGAVIGGFAASAFDVPVGFGIVGGLIAGAAAGYTIAAGR